MIWQRRKAQKLIGQEEFADLIRSCGEKAYNFAYRLSDNEAEAQDLVQEAFVRAYENRASYDSTRPFEAWLLRILHNVYIDEVRRETIRRTGSLDATTECGEGEATSLKDVLSSGELKPEEAIARRETEELVQKALMELPLHYRTAIVLCDLEGLSYEKIASIMACPIGTVRSRIHQGRTLLRRQVERMENGFLMEMKGEKNG